MFQILTNQDWKRAKKSKGVIFNEAGQYYEIGSRNERTPILHSWACGSIDTMDYTAADGVHKYWFEDFNEAQKWLTKKGIKFKSCRTCSPELVIKGINC